MRTLQVFSPKSESTNKSKVGLQIHTLGEVQQYDLGEEFCTLIYFQKRESWNENLCTSPCGSNISTTYPGEQTIWYPIKSSIVMFFGIEICAHFCWATSAKIAAVGWQGNTYGNTWKCCESGKDVILQQIYQML